MAISNCLSPPTSENPHRISVWRVHVKYQPTQLLIARSFTTNQAKCLKEF